MGRKDAHEFNRSLRPRLGNKDHRKNERLQEFLENQNERSDQRIDQLWEDVRALDQILNKIRITAGDTRPVTPLT